MKSKPIGVRFNEDIINMIRVRENIQTPQQVLSFLENKYLNETITTNNLPANKEKILKERNTVIVRPGIIQPLEPSECYQDNSKQIAAIQAGKIPKERDTPIGRKIWLKEQENRIKALI